MVPVHWFNIHVETTASRQFAQLPGWSIVAEKIADIVQRELALAHVMQFQDKLNQITPRCGYLIGLETREAMVGNLTVATELSEAQPSGTLTLPSLPINTQSPPSLLSPSCLSSAARCPSTLAQVRAPSSTYVRVTSFRQEIVEADTVKCAGGSQRLAPHARVVASPTSPTPLTSSHPPTSRTSPATLALTSLNCLPSSSTMLSRQSPSSSRIARPMLDQAATSLVPHPEPPHLISVVIFPSPCPNPRRQNPSQVLLVFDIESSDEDDNTSVAGTLLSWIQTPIGFPNILPLEVNNPVAPAPPPPAYYTVPLSADSFNFPSAVIVLLRDIDVGPRALCTISAACDYDAGSCVSQFMGVGLTREAGQALHNLFVQALTPE